MSLRNANGNEIRRQLEEGNGDSHTKTKRFERSVLYGLVGLAWGLLAPAPVSAASIATIAEWQGYSNGVDAGGVGEYVPDKGFTSLHVDELDLAFNASGSPVDDVIILQFTATYKDGSTSTSGPTGFFQVGGTDVLFKIYPYAEWVPIFPKAPNGRTMKSLTYQMTDATPGEGSTVIIQAHGFETN